MRIEFLEPTTLAEATQLLKQHGDETKIIAGGTAVTLLLQHRLIAPAALISLGRIPDYAFIRREADGLHIGALAHLRDMERSNVVRDFCPALAHAFSVVGNVRVRNQATVGGNLAEADPNSDPPSMLLALDARVTTVSTAGQREIPLQNFFAGLMTTALRPDEILSEVILPTLPASARTAYLRHTSRSMEARPSVSVAAVADLDSAGRCTDLRVAVGAAIATPQRLTQVEARARGEKLTNKLIETIADEYAQALEPLDDALESAWYRREMMRVFVRRALSEINPPQVRSERSAAKSRKPAGGSR